MTENMRVGRYRRRFSDAELDGAVNIPPQRVTLDGRHPDGDADTLETGLKSFFQLDEQGRRILRTLLATAAAHAEANFSSEQQYIQGLYKASPWRDDTMEAICLCGPAGGGKTQLLRAFARLVGGQMPMNVAGHSGLTLAPVWTISTEDGYGLNTLLGQVFHAQSELTDGAHKERGPAKLASPVLVKKARKLAWRECVAIMSIDEPQFGALGDANAKITGLLLQLNRIGPRLVFAANPSLLHKLCSRRQEDRQRLLSRPILLNPLEPSSPDWIAFLTASQHVAPEVLKFDPRADAAEIHLFTFGIRRVFMQLVTHALRLVRGRDKKGLVRMEEIRAAYRSFEFSSNRDDVEILHRQAISGKMARPDLWCPLVSTDASSDHGASTNVHDATAAVERFEQGIEDKLLDGALTPNEAAAVKAIAPAAPRSNSKNSVVQFRGRKTTKADLLEGALAWDKL